jgi:hypothetical protein
MFDNCNEQVGDDTTHRARIECTKAIAIPPGALKLGGAGGSHLK